MTGLRPTKLVSESVHELPASFFAGDALAVAPTLLNKVLVGAGGTAGRVVEVEAYRGADDPGSHAYRGMTPRTEIMFGSPGMLYVYFTYGMHWCANVVAEEEGHPAAILIRALSPLRGHDVMRRRRVKARRDRDLSNGPAKLCQALGIDGTLDGTKAPLFDDGVAPPADPVQTTRIGLTHGMDLPWRWYVADDPHVSRPLHP